MVFMIIIGIILFILGIFLSIRFIWYGAFLIPIGGILINAGVQINNNKRLYNLLHNAKLVGRKLSSIEKSIGPHTSVNLNSDNKRIYLWDNYLELLCDKDNNCIEVLKNIFK